MNKEIMQILLMAIQKWVAKTEERLRQIEEHIQQLATVHAGKVQECEDLKTSLSRARHTNALLQEKLGDWTDEPCPGCLGAGKPTCKSLCAHPERDVCPCACHKPCQDCGGTGHKWVSWEEQFKQLRSFALQSAIGNKFRFKVEELGPTYREVQRDIHPEPLEDTAPGGSSHYVGCPRRTDEHQSCRCALVGQQKF